jgi:hypothetical protein
MTKFEQQCYGMSEQQIKDQFMNSITAKTAGLEMVIAGILSDAQEMGSASTAFATASVNNRRINQQLNVAKFLLFEMMDERFAKESA